MKKIVIFKFEVFNESIKERAMEVAGEFPGVTKVVEVEGEGQLEVRGEFSISELKKELKSIDESVDTIKIVPDGVTEPEIQQQDEGERPINIQKLSKPLNDDASSSNWTGSQENGLWEQTKVVGVGAAGQAKVIGVAAAQKVVAFGVGAVKLLPSNKKWYYGNMKNENEIKAEAQRRKEEEMERNKIRQEMEEAKKRKQAVEEKRQKKIREEKEAENWRKQALANEMKRQKKMKEEEKRRKQDLAEEVKKQNKIKEDEKRRKQASENNSGTTGSLWKYTVSTLANASRQALGTGEPSTSTQTQRTGRPSASTQTQRTGRPSASTQNPFSTQRGNTTS